MEREPTDVVDLDACGNFAAAWVFYFDCPLALSELKALWQMPLYGQRRCATSEPFATESVTASPAFVVSQADRLSEPRYDLLRAAITAASFARVVEFAADIRNRYASTNVMLFLKDHALPFGYFLSPYQRIEEADKRMDVYVKGVSAFDKWRASSAYWGGWSYVAKDPTGDVETLLDARHASILRHIAWSERGAIRDGLTAFSAADQKQLLKYIVAEGFRLNEDVDWAYERIVGGFTDAELARYGVYRLGAYAFWRGRQDWLKDLMNQPRLRDSTSQKFVQALLEGRGRDAAAALGTAWNYVGLSVSDFSIRDYPVLMLSLMAAMTAERGATLTKRLFAILHRINGCVSNVGWEGLERVFDDLRLDVVLFRYLGDGETAPNVHAGFWKGQLPSDALLTAALGLRGGASAFAPGDRLNRNDLLALAEDARAAGYLGVAATLLRAGQVCFDFPDDSPCARAFQAVTAKGGRAFPDGSTDVAARWQSALEALALALKPSKSAVKKKKSALQGKFHWLVTIDTYPSALTVEAISGVVITQKARGGGDNRPKRVPDKKLLGGDVDALLTDRDREIRNTLARGGVLSAAGSYARRTPNKDCLIALCGADNLLVGHVTDYYSPKAIGDSAPLTLIDRESRIALETEAEGLALKVARGQFSDPSAYELKYVRKGVYEVLHCGEDYLKIATLVNRYGTGGRLRIPNEGVAKFEAWVDSTNRALPFSSAGKAASGVKTRSALCEPVVRLSFAGGELSAHLTLRISKTPDLVAEPMAGLVERAVVDEKGARVLIRRDFAAEEKAVAPARAALEPFEASRTETNRWAFDGAEESLDALAALKASAAAGAFALEWPGGKSLALASLAPGGAKFSGGMTAAEWLSVSGSLTLDDGKVLSFVDLLKNFDSREGAYVKLTDERYLKLTSALARRVEALKGAGVVRGDRLEISPAALPSLEKSARETEADAALPLPELVRDRLERVREAMASPVRAPSAFKCQMRPYQVEGYEWLSRLAACGIGACLADDMGLGKTIQLIALLLARRREGTSLVVAPASVVFNWRAETARFAPSLKVAVIGQNPNADEDDLAAIARRNDLIVTSYGVLASREEKFVAIGWNVIVLDEAQAIKNHLTQRAKSVKALSAKFRVVATGTPIENRLNELWSLFDFVNPGMLGGESHFAKVYTARGAATPRLKRLVKPLILRRLKRDVLTDLPEKEEITLSVLLGDEERHAYEAVRQNALARLKSADPNDKLAILAELTRLRRFCCHPSLVMKEVSASAKLDALEGLLDDLRGNHHRALVFSQFVDFLSIVRRRLDARGWNYKYLDGSTSKAERERSVEAFQGGEGDFFLISLKAGGMGLNLTAANYVILLDPWWNPAVENQAADRVHRIGQRLPVTVYRLIAKDTIEEKVVDLHAKKLALAEDVLSAGSGTLSAEAMLDLLRD